MRSNQSAPKTSLPFPAVNAGRVMVESLDAYRLARYLRAKGKPIEGIEDFLFRYCEPEPLTEEGFPIYMLKTKAPNSSCIFLTDGRCSVYPARTRTCRIVAVILNTACVWTGTGATLPAAGYPSRTGCIRILRGKTKNM